MNRKNQILIRSVSSGLETKSQRYFPGVSGKFCSVIFIIFIFEILSLIFSLPVNAAVGINRTINFQGKIVNKVGETNIANGSYSFTFKFYDAASGGTQLPSGSAWTETKSLTVTDGIFRTALGDSTAIPSALDFNSDSIYLDMTFNSETFTTRIRMSAVAYAFNAEKVAGLTVTNTTGTLTIPNAKTISFADAFTTSGAFPLTLTQTASTNVTLPTTGTLATLAGAETLTNKTIGSTGLIFSGASTDIDTAAAEGLVLQGRAASSFSTTAGNITFEAAGTGTIGTVQIGVGGAGSTTPDFLGLDVKSDTGDPAGGFEGAIYYNTFDNKFRCYQGAAWADCIGAGLAGSGTSGQIAFFNGAASITSETSGFGWDSTNNLLTIVGDSAQATQTTAVISSSATTLTTGGLFSVSATGAPGSSWTGDLAKIEYNNADVDVDGNALKVGLLGAAGGEGISLNITTAQTGTSALALRVNDDGTYTDSTPFVINNSGKVGIGFTTPEAKLDVRDTNKFTGTGYFNTLDQVNLSLVTTETQGTDLGGVIGLGGSYTSGSDPYIFGSIKGAKENGTNNNLDGYLSFFTTDHAAGFGQANEHMRITSDGLIGIGDTSPDAKLEVLSESEQLRLSYTDDAADVRFSLDSSGDLTLDGSTDGTGDQVIYLTGFKQIIGSTDLLIAPANTEAFSLGNNFTSAIQLTTDGTGNGEVILPTGSIATGEILDATLLPADLDLTTADSPGDEECLTYEGATTDFEWQTCGAGGSTSWDAIGDPSGNGAIAMAETTQTLDWNTAATAAAFNGLSITLTNDATTDSNIQNGLRIDNLNDGGSTGTTESLLVIDNSDTNEAVTNGIEFVDAGGGFTNLFNVNGTTISSTEFTRLDGKDAALVDQNDFTSGDGAGATSSGSGLESGTGGIGLLQGCSDEQVLKWNDSSAVWECGSDRATVHVVKAANETVTSSTTVQDDDHLTFAIGANETFIFEFHVVYTTNASGVPDIKFAIGTPSGATCTYGVVSDSTGANSPDGSTNCGTATVGTTAVGTKSAIVSGSVINGSNSGSITLQWAQIISDANGTTIVSGSVLTAYKVSGADLAETYYTADSNIEPGTVVSIDSNVSAGVKKSINAYDKNLLGIISTKPGLVIGDVSDHKSGRPVLVALSGRVPVNVTTENGPIRPGDYLTSSSVPGIAMRATKAGAIVGQAMTSYEGEGEGQVVAFVKTSFSQGASIASVYPGLTDGNSAEVVKDFSAKVLEQFMTNNQIAPTAENNSEILTDTLLAGLEIVTPKITTDKLQVNTISSATENDITIQLGSGDKLVIKGKGESGKGEVITFDNAGNAFFAGTITADKIKANQIEGLEILETGIKNSIRQAQDEQELRIKDLENSFAASQSAVLNATDSSRLSSNYIDGSASSPQGYSSTELEASGEVLTLKSLNVEGLARLQDVSARQATISADFRVKGNGLIEGILNVVDTLMAKNLIVSGISDFFSKVTFRDDVDFRARPTFNKDTGGTVVVVTGEREAEVRFDKEYDAFPIVNVSIMLDKIEGQIEQEELEEAILKGDIKYIVTNRSKAGFAIKINKELPMDLAFSWTAISVSDKLGFGD